MKLTDLKSPYRELAEMRREQNYDANCYDTGYFAWKDTPEGHDFWYKVAFGEQLNIPQSSLDELSEWQKGKEPKKEPDYELTAIIESPDHRLFTAAVAAMQGMCANPQNTGSHKLYAEQAVLQAQALLTELNKVSK